MALEPFGRALDPFGVALEPFGVACTVFFWLLSRLSLWTLTRLHTKQRNIKPHRQNVPCLKYFAWHGTPFLEGGGWQVLYCVFCPTNGKEITAKNSYCTLSCLKTFSLFLGFRVRPNVASCIVCLFILCPRLQSV